MSYNRYDDHRYERDNYNRRSSVAGGGRGGGILDYRDRNRGHVRVLEDGNRRRVEDYDHRDRDHDRNRGRGGYDERDRTPDRDFRRRGGGRFNGGDDRGPYGPSGGGRNFGGRGVGRGGRGGGRNTSMSDSRSCLAILDDDTKGFTDSNIMDVLHPTDLQSPVRVSGRVSYPLMQEWRKDLPLGADLMDTGHCIRANYFTIDGSKVSQTIHQYSVKIFPYKKDGSLDEQDCAAREAKEDPRVTVSLLQALRDNHPNWSRNEKGPIGFAYDGFSTLFTSQSIFHPEMEITAAHNDMGQLYLEESVNLKHDKEEGGKKYKVVLAEICEVAVPKDGNWRDDTGVGSISYDLIRALDISILQFARWQQVHDDPEWYVCGPKAFRARAETNNLGKTGVYKALKGYYVGLKTCLAGLVLVSDLNVTCFLACGEMINLMWQAGGFRDFQDFHRACQNGLNHRAENEISAIIKGCKIKLTHSGHWKKCKMVGPPANHRLSEFEFNGKMMDVGTYFEEVFGIKIRYPDLPTVNIGSKQRPLLIPAELVQVPGGQNRSSKVKGDMTAQMIRLAAAKPQDRVTFLTDTGVLNNDSGGIVNVLSNDVTSKAFGLDSVRPELLQVRARLLPQAKLVYGNGQIYDTKLSGSWNLERKKFREPVLDKQYQVLIVQSGGAPSNFKENVLTFIANIDRESEQTGMHLKFHGPPVNCVDNIPDLREKFQKMNYNGTEIVVVLMTQDSYANVKFAADSIGLITQCVKWKNVERSPRGLFSNILMKVNSKLGGKNHTLVSRGDNMDGQATFQEPPNSLAWVLNDPCMFVGIDVSHPDPGSDRPSIAAVTGSIDGCGSQYVAHISSQIGKTEMVACLEDSIYSLFQAFKNKNGGQYPKHIICYRDGVSDSQFDVVLDHELPAIRGALARHGIMEGTCKILVLICQKNHHTRLVYEESIQDSRFHNVSPGIVVDACGGMDSITSSTQIEFYLNSHATIQGTSKPTKYTLIYDEIGMKLSEIELMTYWLCYLYARCTRSVSIATPVYYAHWAAKRGKNIMAAGGTPEDLKKISDLYSMKDANPMFFV